MSQYLKHVFGSEKKNFFFFFALIPSLTIFRNKKKKTSRFQQLSHSLTHHTHTNTNTHILFWLTKQQTWLINNIFATQPHGSHTRNALKEKQVCLKKKCMPFFYLLPFRPLLFFVSFFFHFLYYLLINHFF